MKLSNSGKALAWVILVILMAAVVINGIVCKVFAVTSVAAVIGLIWLFILMLWSSADAEEIDRLNKLLAQAREDRDKWNDRHRNAEETSEHRKQKIEELKQELEAEKNEHGQCKRRIKTLEEQIGDKDHQIGRLSALNKQQESAIKGQVEMIGDLQGKVSNLEREAATHGRVRPPKPPKNAKPE